MSASAAEALRALVGTILVVAGAAKLARGGTLVAFLEAAGVATVAALHISRLAPWVEATVGVALLGGIAVVPGLAVATFLAAAFVVLHARVIVAGVSVSCRCFGALDRDLVRLAGFARSVALFGVSCAALAIELAGPASGGAAVPSGEALFLGVLSAVGFVAAFGLLSAVENFVEARNRLLRAAGRPGLGR
jgi:hypothetical protein